MHGNGCVGERTTNWWWTRNARTDVTVCACTTRRMDPVTTVEVTYRSVRQKSEWNNVFINRNESMIDWWTTGDFPTVCLWYGPFLCRIGMTYVLSTLYQFKQWRYHSHLALRWLFRCHRHLGILTPPLVCCQYWSLSLGQMERCTTRNRYRATRKKCSIDRMREGIVQLHLLLRSITEHFDNRELIHLWNRGRH